MTSLAPLARPSGGFAMVAIDQREALRAMFAPHQDAPVTDAQLTDFKVNAARELSPHASGLLVDRQFGLEQVLAHKAVAPGCGLIVAADTLLPGPGELVADTAIDEGVSPDQARADGAVALKLLVLWRPGEPAGPRVEMAQRFIARCRAAGLISIIEPVARPPRGAPAPAPAPASAGGGEGILAAACELGALGADLYKAEVPLHGAGPQEEIARQCAELTSVIASPWVVLSSGVDPADFGRAVTIACEHGASGFLAGRAVWRPVIGAGDVAGALRSQAVARLAELASRVDGALARRAHA